MTTPSSTGVAVITRLRPALPADGQDAESAVAVVGEGQVEVCLWALRALKTQPATLASLVTQSADVSNISHCYETRESNRGKQLRIRR